MSGLKNLRTLLLPGPSFNPAAGSKLDANEQLKALASLSSLEKLHFSLHFLRISTFRIKVSNISGLTQIKELRLAQTKVKGPSLAPFVKLEDFDLSYSPFDDEGMRYLSGLKELKHLALRDTLVTDEGLKHIAGLTKLEVLDLYGAKVTDAGLKQLSNLTHLQKLNVLGASITDQGLDALAG